MARLGRWLKGAFRCYGANFVVLTAMAGISVVFEVTMGFFLASQFPEMASAQGNPMGMKGSEHIAALLSVPFLFAAWSGSFVYLHVKDSEAAVPWWRAFGKGFGFIAPYFGIHFMIGVLMIGLGAPGLVLYTLELTVGSYIAWGVAGLVLVYLMARWSMSYPILAVEGGGFIQAMKRSKELTRPAIGAVIGINVLLLAISGVFEGIMYAVESDSTIVMGIFTVPYSAFSFSATYVVYRELSQT